MSAIITSILEYLFNLSNHFPMWSQRKPCMKTCCGDELTDHKSAPVQVSQESPHDVPTSRRSSRLKKSPLVYQADTGKYMERQT